MGQPLSREEAVAVGVCTELNPDDWSYRHVWMFMPLLYFVGVAMARHRYQ